MSFLQGLFGQPNVAKLEAKRDVPGLIKALTYNEDKTVRKAAAAALGRIGEARAVESLVASLKDGNAVVREAAALALGQLGAVEPLTVALQDSQSDVRAAAALALGQLGDARAVESLVAALKDGEPSVYNAAGEALVKIGDTRAVWPLTNLLHDMNRSQMAFEALVKLAKIGDASAFGALAAKLEYESDYEFKRTVQTLVQISDARAVEVLVADLKCSSENHRMRTAEALTQLGVPDDPDTRAWHAVAAQDWKAAATLGPVALPPLAAALKHGTVKVRKGAAEALTQLGVPDDPDTRAWHAVIMRDWKAATALGPVAVAPLLETLQDDSSPDVRKATVSALVKIGRPAVEPLVAALEGHIFHAHSEVAEALGEIGDARAVKPLISKLRGSGGLVRDAMAAALAKIGQPAVEPLTAVFRDSDKDVRSRAAETLVKIGRPAVKPLAAALKDSNADVRKAAAEALTQLGVPDDPDTRAWHAVVMQDWKAVTALGPAAVPPLAIAFKGNVDVATRQAIIEVLGIIGAPATETLTAIFFQDSDLNKYGNQEIAHMAARALEKTGGPEAVDALILALYDKWEGVYYSAVAALHSTGDPRAVGPIIEYLESHPAPQGDALKYERRDYPLREPTRDVALEALQAITRQNYGKDVEAWRKWFDASGLPRFSHPGRNQAQSDSREKVVRDMRRIIGEYEQQLPIIRTLLTTLIEALETGKTSRGERVNRGEIPTVLDQLTQARRAEGQYKLAGALSSLSERLRSIESQPTRAPEEKSSVSPAAPVTVAAVATPVADAARATASEHVEEQTKFDVILKKVGENKINVIKAVRFLTNLSLKETLDLLESAPAPILTAVSKQVAAEAKAKIEAEGAKVEVK